MRWSQVRARLEYTKKASTVCNASYVEALIGLQHDGEELVSYFSKDGSYFIQPKSVIRKSFLSFSNDRH
jgi:hypothetical protein